MLVNLQTILPDAQKNNYAIAGFNIFSLAWAEAVIQAASDVSCPTIIMCNKAMMDSFPPSVIGIALSRLAEKATVPVCVHLDHCSDIMRIQEAIENGFSSVMYDGSSLPFEQNLKNTQSVVQFAHSKGVSVEAELGTVAYSDMPHSTGSLSKPQEVEQFTHACAVDALAISIGNIHRLTEKTATIDFSLLKAIEQKTQKPLVIHGTSGITEQDIKTLLSSSVSKFNIGTALRMAFAKSLRTTLQEHPALFDWLQIEKQCIQSVYEAAYYHLVLLSHTEHNGEKT